MSRSGYTYDCENLALYRGAVESAMRGKRGQAFLRDLRAALDAMPVKALVYGTLQDERTGQVCALGAVGVKRGVPMPKIDDEDYGESKDMLGKLFDVAPCLAAEVQFINDEAKDWQTPSPESPEVRYARVSKWVDEHLKTVTA